MAVAETRVTVGTTATLLNVVSDNDSISGSRLIVICPTSDIYFGGPSVTTSTGTLLSQGSTLSEKVMPGDKWYAAAAASVVVHVTQTGI